VSFWAGLLLSRIKIDVDKDWEGRTIKNLGALDYVTLSSLTADPGLVAGRIWFRRDLTRLFFTPDGSRTVSLFPVEWATITNKPTVFPSDWNMIANKPSTFPSDWNMIANKPSTFPPSPHRSTHEAGGSDPVTNLDSLSIRGVAIFGPGPPYSYPVLVRHHLIPESYSYNLGTSGRPWGNVYALTKYGVWKHPLHNPERYIAFASVEGPKITVEDWGVARLEDGVAFVTLSEEFVALMSDRADYAVFLTPEGPCRGLYVSKKLFYGFEVRELGGGRSSVTFSWLVKAVRLGDEDAPVLHESEPVFATAEEAAGYERKRSDEMRKKREDMARRMAERIKKYREATGGAT
jgi:hypothetical protein